MGQGEKKKHTERRRTGEFMGYSVSVREPGSDGSVIKTVEKNSNNMGKAQGSSPS